jgi:hypothetical protein
MPYSDEGSRTVKVAIYLLIEALKKYYASDDGKDDEVWIGVESKRGGGSNQGSYKATFDFERKPSRRHQMVAPPVSDNANALKKCIYTLIAPPSTQRMAMMILRDLLLEAPIGSGVDQETMARTGSVLLYFQACSATIERLELLREVGWLDDAFGYLVESLELAEPHDERLRRKRHPALSRCFTPILQIPPQQKSIDVSFAVFSTLDSLKKPFRVRIDAHTSECGRGERVYQHRVEFDLRSSMFQQLPLDLNIGSHRLVQVEVSQTYEHKSAAQRAGDFLVTALKSLIGAPNDEDPFLYATFEILSSSPNRIQVRVTIEPYYPFPTAQIQPEIQVRASDTVKQVTEQKPQEMKALIPRVEERRATLAQRVSARLKRFFDRFRGGGGGGGYSGGSGSHNNQRFVRGGKSDIIDRRTGAGQGPLVGA